MPKVLVYLENYTTAFGDLKNITIRTVLTTVFCLRVSPKPQIKNFKNYCFLAFRKTMK